MSGFRQSRDGSLLHEFYSVGSQVLGYLLPITRAGDIDHDGFDDIAVGMVFDDAEFECLGGTSIRLQYQRTSGDLRVRIEIQRVGGDQKLTWTPNAATATAKKSFSLDKDGRYELRIERLGGTSGDYSLKTSIVKQPKNTSFGFIKTVKGTGQSGAPRVLLRATAGTTLSGSVEGVKGIPAQPELEFLTPNGQTLDLSATLDLMYRDETGIAQIEFPMTGTFELRTVGPGGNGTKAKFVIDIPRVAGHERIDID